jgi:hypothetical protein
VITKRKTRKRKRIQHRGTLEYGATATQVAAAASVAAEQAKNARGGGDHAGAQPALKRCSNCSRTGHNARTCKKDTQISSETLVSTAYTGSLFNSNRIENS